MKGRPKIHLGGREVVAVYVSSTEKISWLEHMKALSGINNLNEFIRLCVREYIGKMATAEEIGAELAKKGSELIAAEAETERKRKEFEQTEARALAISQISKTHEKQFKADFNIAIGSIAEALERGKERAVAEGQATYLRQKFGKTITPEELIAKATLHNKEKDNANMYG